MGVCAIRNLHTLGLPVTYKFCFPGDVNDSLSVKVFVHSFNNRNEVRSFISVYEHSMRDPVYIMARLPRMHCFSVT